jgi:hypothetical protein
MKKPTKSKKKAEDKKDQVLNEISSDVINKMISDDFVGDLYMPQCTKH